MQLTFSPNQQMDTKSVSLISSYSFLKTLTKLVSQQSHIHTFLPSMNKIICSQAKFETHTLHKTITKKCSLAKFQIYSVKLLKQSTKTASTKDTITVTPK